MAMQEPPPRLQRALPWCGEDREGCTTVTPPYFIRTIRTNRTVTRNSAPRRTIRTIAQQLCPRQAIRTVAPLLYAKEESAFRIPPSAFRLPPSAFRLPHSAFRIPHLPADDLAVGGQAPLHLKCKILILIPKMTWNRDVREGGAATKRPKPNARHAVRDCHTLEV